MLRLRVLPTIPTLFATQHNTRQTKKVHDLGELPALDWSNASAKLLVTAIVVGVIFFSLYSGWMDDCVQLGKLCLREWLNGLCVAVGAYFLIELLAKVGSIEIYVLCVF